MSVRPIDIQYTTMQAENVQKVQHTQHNFPQQQQAYAHIQHIHQEEVKRKQSSPVPRTEDIKIRDEARHSRKNRYIPKKVKGKVSTSVSEDTPHKVDIQI